MKNISIILLILFIISPVKAKINDKRIWNNFYNSCIAEYRPGGGISRFAFKQYCQCGANQVTEQFTMNEIKRLENQMRYRSNNDKQKILLLNRKMSNIFRQCFINYIK